MSIFHFIPHFLKSGIYCNYANERRSTKLHRTTVNSLSQAFWSGDIYDDGFLKDSVIANILIIKQSESLKDYPSTTFQSPMLRVLLSKFTPTLNTFPYIIVRKAQLVHSKHRVILFNSQITIRIKHRNKIHN